MKPEMKSQLEQGDVEIELEDFLATRTEDKQHVKRALTYANHVWLITDFDKEYQVGEVFWDTNGSLVLHAEADELHMETLRQIADFIETLEEVTIARHRATTAPEKDCR